MAWLVGMYALAEELMVSVMTSNVTRSVQSIFVVLVLAYIFGIAFLFTARRMGWEIAYGNQVPAPLEATPEEEPQKSGAPAALKGLGLTEREVEVVSLILRGYGVPAVADELCVSQSTVRSHLKRVYRVCDVHSRQELVELCERLAADGDRSSRNS
jgi:DNA-binding CsgD family transcriptional regulator